MDSITLFLADLFPFFWVTMVGVANFALLLVLVDCLRKKDSLQVFGAVVMQLILVALFWISKSLFFGGVR